MWKHDGGVCRDSILFCNILYKYDGKSGPYSGEFIEFIVLNENTRALLTVALFLLVELERNKFPFSATDREFRPRGASSDLPEKCVIWASEYNLGPQKWGGRGGRAPPPPGSATAFFHLVVLFCKFNFPHRKRKMVHRPTSFWNISAVAHKASCPDE